MCILSCIAFWFKANLVAIRFALLSNVSVSKSPPLSTPIIASSTRSIAKSVNSLLDLHRFMKNEWLPEFVDITNLSGSINCNTSKVVVIPKITKNSPEIINADINDAPLNIHHNPLKSSSQSNL